MSKFAAKYGSIIQSIEQKLDKLFPLSDELQEDDDVLKQPAEKDALITYAPDSNQQISEESNYPLGQENISTEGSQFDFAFATLSAENGDGNEAEVGVIMDRSKDMFLHNAEKGEEAQKNKTTSNNQAERGLASAESSPDEESSSITLTLFFSSDKMKAYIRAQDYQKGKDAENKIQEEVIYDLLKEKSVAYGIDAEGITEYCKGKALYKDFQVAEGLKPVKGEDGSIEYFFQLNLRYAPQEKGDGRVDYKELGLVRNVNIEDVLCKITMPTEGIAGINVLGEPVKPIPGKEVIISSGKGVRVSEDGTEYIAESNGMVEINNGVVEVKDVYTVQGDVGISTGNIRFNGAVIVLGSVLSNYSVFANGDIIVNGYVESSFLNSTGNILVNNGINGMKKGFLKADGNITVKFAEMAKIVAGGNFYCDYCVNCDVRAGEMIAAKGKRASLLGGNYISGKLIDAKTIGSTLNIPMEVQIIPHWRDVRNLEVRPVERIREINEKLCEQEISLGKLRNSFSALEKEQERLSRKKAMGSVEESNANKMRTKVIMQDKLNLKREIDEIVIKKEKLEALIACEDCMVIVRKIVHTGTRITIGNAMLRINGHKEVVTFTESDGEIGTLNIVPEG